MLRVDRMYNALLRRRGRTSWILIAAMVLLGVLSPSSYALDYQITSELTLPNSNAAKYLISGSSTSDQSPNPAQPTIQPEIPVTIGALYASLDTKRQVTALDLKMISLASRQIEMARTPQGAKSAAIQIIKAEYPKWGSAQQQCLVKLWDRESHWNYKAHNYRSGAHGIAQALPAGKMEIIALDWRTNPVTQIRWGLNYIDKRYGTPCKAYKRALYRGGY